MGQWYIAAISNAPIPKRITQYSSINFHLSYSSHSLEVQAQLSLELPVPRNLTRSDLSKVCRVDVQVRVPQDRNIQHIPCIDSKLHALPL